MGKITAENRRIAENSVHHIFWKKWGPYLSERQWGTVREDYSEDGEAWDYFPFDHSRSRVYRWGEDGLGGISDINQDLCFAPAFWNGRDPLLKERLFGLTSREGNHGEDVKELYYYLDNTPTHSYMKYLYKYPQGEFPYQKLIEENRRRTKQEAEYELLDTGIFGQNRYFDIFIEYAKAAPEDILIRIEVCNRGEETADITVLPTLWFRNTWAFGITREKPSLQLMAAMGSAVSLEAVHSRTGRYYLFAEKADTMLFTENETNTERLFGVPNQTPFVKDAFHEAVIRQKTDLFREKRNGTKAALLYRLGIPGNQSRTIRLRLMKENTGKDPFGRQFDLIFSRRIAEADEFYEQFTPDDPVSDVVRVQRQAFAGMLWSKQYYNYEVETWLNGDSGLPLPPPQETIRPEPRLALSFQQGHHIHA